MIAPTVPCRRPAAVDRRSACRTSMAAANASNQPTRDGGDSARVKGVIRASRPRPTVTADKLVIGALSFSKASRFQLPASRFALPAISLPFFGAGSWELEAGSWRLGAVHLHLGERERPLVG